VKHKITLLIVLVTVIISPAMAEDPVEFADANLKAAVETTLWISDPTPSDMLELTSLYAASMGIRSLNGLQHAKNLQTLYVRWNELSSLSALSSLTNLRTLDAHGNHEISSLAPLSELIQLETLVVRINKIASLSPLANLVNLRKLDVRWNQISSVSALSNLTNLETCHLQWNEISSISALAQLTNLQSLDVRANPLNQEACEIYIPQIIENNPGIDLKYDACSLHELIISSSKGGHVSQPGEGKFTYENGEVAHLEAQPDSGYVFVSWTGSYSETANPLFVSVRHGGEVRANFESLSGDDDGDDNDDGDDDDPGDLPSTDVPMTFYVDDDAADDPGPDDATWSDPKEDGTVEHPFDRIQEAIDEASDGAQVVVNPGTYHEYIDLGGKSLLVTGINPAAKGYPVVDGNGVGPVVRFTQQEDPNCTLSGFVITGGRGDLAGAILCVDSHPTITNCLIVGNSATDPNGAAIYCTGSDATFVNCTIADNYGDALGGAFYMADCNVAVVSSIVWGNGPEEIHLSGDGTPAITYSDLAGGWLGFGNIERDPLFAQAGYWADPNDPNVALESRAADALWVPGDYHLKSRGGRWNAETQMWISDMVTSPCIDAGNRFDAVGWEPIPNNNLINMGAYGGTVEASKSP